MHIFDFPEFDLLIPNGLSGENLAKHPYFFYSVIFDGFAPGVFLALSMVDLSFNLLVMGAVPGAPADVDGFFAGVVWRSLRRAGGGDAGNDRESHEESPFIFKATDFGELIGKLGKQNFASVFRGLGRLAVGKTLDIVNRVERSVHGGQGGGDSVFTGHQGEDEVFGGGGAAARSSSSPG